MVKNMNNPGPDNDPITSRLIELMAKMPDEAPPADFTARVMHHVQSKRLGFWRRSLGWIQQPLTVVTIRPLTVGAFAGALACLFWISTMVGPKIGHPPQSVQLAGDCRTVTFRLDWPAARKVTVIGSFNQWQTQGYRMHRNRPDGSWQLGLELEPGVYAYAFVIDDQTIIADPRALWEQDDGFGNRNSMVSVENECQHDDRT